MAAPDTLTARRQERRQRLIRAGIDQMGAKDHQRMTLRSVLQAAGLTERYFYESFEGFSSFIVAVYEHVGAHVLNALARAGDLDHAVTPAGIRATIHAFVGMCDTDPALIRTLLIAPLREPELAMQGVTLSDEFARFAESTMDPHSPAGLRRLSSLGKVGALTLTAAAYLRGDGTFTRLEFVTYCCNLAGVGD